MAKIKQGDPNPNALRTVDEDGKAPGTRIKNAHQAFEICKELDDSDRKRRRKRSRIFKAYNRFPPSEYSTIANKGSSWQSNVNFGMMAFLVDNNLSSFFDMVTERTQAAEIITKFGDPRQRSIYSEAISEAFDKVIREWDEYLFNVEQDLLDMLLYNKGIEMWSDIEGCMSEHISADDLLVPDNTKVSMCNWTEFAVKRSYTLLELYRKIEDGETGADMGWNRDAVINAMRWQRDSWKKRTPEKFVQDIKDGNITLAGHLKETVETYELYVREFDDTVTKVVVLQDYAPGLSLTIGRPSGLTAEDWQNKNIDKEGFLFAKTKYADCREDLMSVFMDCAGGGYWHRVTSLAEKIFVQCRQYDFTMNAIMDAVKINMSLILQASTQDAANKIKELVFGPYVFIPADVPFVQQRLQLPTGEATQAVQYMMADMRSGLGEYQVQQRGQGGEVPTATQTQLDAAESAKLTGTQLKRYNGQFTFYFRTFFKKLTTLKDGEKDYDHFKKFKQYLDERGVPKEAWAWDNIESINSNMLAGAGSPSYKLMAAQKTLEITNMTPKDAGQANAIEDALAALHGRSNVRRYLPAKVSPDLTFDEQTAHWENAWLADMALIPNSVPAYPQNNHVYHVSVHLDDMEQTIGIVNDKMTQNNISDSFAESAMFKLLNQGGHTMAHIEFIKRDSLKQDMVKQFMARLSGIQRSADKMAQQMQEMKQARQQDFDPANDPDIKKKLALSQIDVQTAQQLSQIKLGSMATSHAQRMENEQEKTANQIAMERAKTVDKINTNRKVLKTQGNNGDNTGKPTGG